MRRPVVRRVCCLLGQHGKEGVNGSSPLEGFAKSPHLPSVVPGRHHCRWLDHEQNGAAKGMRTVHDAAWDRHPLTGTEHERFTPLYLELKPAFEHEKELILVLMLVPIDEA